jgi:2-polyprenyl-6-methoxyphenol hydroxylase-like FAD-dependent oxidoreductase
VGVRAKNPGGEVGVRAPLVVACDGRHSTMRARAGFAVDNLGAPMDVLWFRLRHDPNDPEESLGFFNAGSILVTINRGQYWQCAFVIPKGSFDALRARGLDNSAAGSCKSSRVSTTASERSPIGMRSNFSKCAWTE